MRTIEKICYLYTKELNSSIMKSKERVVKAFLTLIMEVRNDANLWRNILIECTERAERTEKYLEKRDAERRLQREKRAMKKGVEKGKKEGAISGKRENLYTLFLLKYNRDEKEWLRTLNVRQLNNALQEFLSCETFEELKEKGV